MLWLSLAQIVEHVLELQASKALRMRLSLRGLRRRANVSCSASSRCPGDPLICFGGHVGSSVLYFLVNAFLTLLVIVDRCDAYVVVNSDLLIHLAVNYVPAVGWANPL